jgi:natural product precursor
MKKLSLKNANTMLSRKEMKAISGGYVGSFTCYCDGYNMGQATSYEQCKLLCEINGC